jgi:hypothetical protein
MHATIWKVRFVHFRHLFFSPNLHIAMRIQLWLPFDDMLIAIKRKKKIVHRRVIITSSSETPGNPDTYLFLRVKRELENLQNLGNVGTNSKQKPKRNHTDHFKFVWEKSKPDWSLISLHIGSSLSSWSALRWLFTYHKLQKPFKPHCTRHHNHATFRQRYGKMLCSYFLPGLAREVVQLFTWARVTETCDKRKVNLGRPAQGSASLWTTETPIEFPENTEEAG